MASCTSPTVAKTHLDMLFCDELSCVTALLARHCLYVYCESMIYVLLSLMSNSALYPLMTLRTLLLRICILQSANFADEFVRAVKLVQAPLNHL